MSLLCSRVPLLFPSITIFLSNRKKKIQIAWNCFDWGPPTAPWQPPQNFPQDSGFSLDLSHFGDESYKIGSKPALISGHPSPLLSQPQGCYRKWTIWLVPFAFPITSVSPAHKHWEFLPVFQGKRNARSHHGVPGYFKWLRDSCSVKSTNNDSPSVHITQCS